MKSIRIDKLLGNMGYGSRREVAALVRRAAFIFDGHAITDASQSVPLDPALLAAAQFCDAPLDPVSPLTLMLHKPRGYTCSHDEEGMLIYDLLPGRWRARKPIISSVGRLDKESTGLVLITDDGALLHKIISPKHHVWKEYEVVLRDPLTGDEAALFASGEMTLKSDDKPLKPAYWTPTGEKSGIMALAEGRYHQIRRMFAACGNHVETLHRRAVGGLNLGDLAEGTYCVLGDEDLEKIFAATQYS